MHVAQYSLPPGTDLSPFFAPLPGGMCPSSHWGHMLSGELVLQYEDGTQETNRAGEVFHWPPGHTARTDAGAEFMAYTLWAEEERVVAQLAAASQLGRPVGVSTHRTQ